MIATIEIGQFSGINQCPKDAYQKWLFYPVYNSSNVLGPRLIYLSHVTRSGLLADGETVGRASSGTQWEDQKVPTPHLLVYIWNLL